MYALQVKHLEPWEKGSRKTAGQTGMCGGVSKVLSLNSNLLTFSYLSSTLFFQYSGTHSSIWSKL